jgi:thioredoxin reductase
MAVAVAGVDERACKAALLLADQVRHVHLLCPEGALFAAPATLARLAARGNVTLRAGARVTAIHGTSQVTGIAVADGRGGEELAVGGVFLYLYGRRPDTEFLKGLVACRNDGAVAVSGPGRTSREGIYAVGPVAAEVGGAPPYGALAEAITRRLAARPA